MYTIENGKTDNNVRDLQEVQVAGNSY